MGPGADVRSIPALRDWLVAVTTYSSEVSESLSGIQIEIRRGFEWLSEQLTLWQRAVRTCEEEVVQAKAELAARKFPGWDGKMPDTTIQERNLRRAKARLVDVCSQSRLPFGRERGVGAERGDRRVGHRERAADTGFGVGEREEARRGALRALPDLSLVRRREGGTEKGDCPCGAPIAAAPTRR